MKGVVDSSSQGTQIHNEVNNKFILYKDVIFLEFSKNGKTIEWKLDHLDRFTHVKKYHDFDDDIPHI